MSPRFIVFLIDAFKVGDVDGCGGVTRPTQGMVRPFVQQAAFRAYGQDYATQAAGRRDGYSAAFERKNVGPTRDTSITHSMAQQVGSSHYTGERFFVECAVTQDTLCQRLPRPWNVGRRWARHRHGERQHILHAIMVAVVAQPQCDRSPLFFKHINAAHWLCQGS